MECLGNQDNLDIVSVNAASACIDSLDAPELLVNTLDFASIWKRSSDILKSKLDSQLYCAWIKPLDANCSNTVSTSVDNSFNCNSSCKDDTAIVVSIIAPNKFCRDHVERHYGEIISETINDVSGYKNISLQFKSADIKLINKKLTDKILTNKVSSNQIEFSDVNSINCKSVNEIGSKGQLENTSLHLSNILSQNESCISRSLSKNRPLSRQQDQKNSSNSNSVAHNDESNLNGDYNFSNFVVGSCNQFAHAASLRVAENPGTAYNPLFIYGGVGLGKTHLVNAIGNATRRRGKKVLLVSSEVFVNELINSLRSNNMQQFKSKFRSLDVLIIDDIQFIIGKERTQEEFFHTFNELHQRSKQIVITSDKTPQELIGLEERLRTRFSSGLSADLQAPDFETRIAILAKKADKAGILLSSDVSSFLAEKINSNIRELEGALNRIQAISSIHGSPITLNLAESALKGILQSTRKEITTESIQRTVASKFNVSLNDLLGKRRTQNVALARHVAMYLCRRLTGRSYPEVGAVFGGRDHSTAIHACKKLEETMKIEEELKNTVELLEKNLCQ